MLFGDFNLACSINPSSGLINQQGSSSYSISFLDRGLHRTMTCTFSRIEVDLVENEGRSEAEEEDLEEDVVGLGYEVVLFVGIGMLLENLDDD